MAGPPKNKKIARRYRAWHGNCVGGGLNQAILLDARLDSGVNPVKLLAVLGMGLIHRLHRFGYCRAGDPEPGPDRGQPQ